MLNTQLFQYSLDEVVNYLEIKTPISFGGRIKTAFVDSWRGFAAGLQNFAVGLVLRNSDIARIGSHNSANRNYREKLLSKAAIRENFGKLKSI
jgi:hypothetical protein